MNKKIYYIVGGVLILSVGTFLFIKLKKNKSVLPNTTVPEVKSSTYTPEVSKRINELRELIKSDQEKFNSYKTKQSRQNVENEINKNLAELNNLLNT